MPSKKKLLINIFEATYVANIYKLIDENRYIRVLQTIFENGFRTYHIDSFDKLSIHLKKIGLIKSYKISILLYLRDDNHRKLHSISKYFPDISSAFKQKIKMTERISDIAELLETKLCIARSFIKSERIEMIYFNQSNETGESGFVKQLQSEKIKEEWFHYNRDDIIMRLHNLVDLFTLDQLKYIGVDLIRSNTVVKINVVDLQNYYNRTIEKLIVTIRSWIQICAIYCDIEAYYVETCRDINRGKRITNEIIMEHFAVTHKKY